MSKTKNMRNEKKSHRNGETDHKVLDHKGHYRHPIIGVRMPAGLIAQIDAYAKSHGVGRSHAVRVLTEKALGRSSPC